MTRCAFALSVLLGVSSRALATPFTFVDVEAGFSSATVTTQNGPSSLSVSGTGIGGIGTATSTGSAGFGTLGVFTTGSATPGPQVSGPTIVSRVEASFQDLLFIGGPDGAPVDITISLDLTGSCSTTVTTSFADASCLTTASLAVPTSGLSVSTSGGGQSQTATVTWVGNSEFPISADMLAIGSAYNGSFTDDFSHTLHTYISSTTPGVVITSQSGHDYSPSVDAPVATPEPATLALLGTGLLLVVRQRIRRR